MKNYILYVSAVLLIMSGCSVGPKYVSPSVSMPASWSDSGQGKLRVNNEEAWWRNFHDPILNELIEQYSVYNLNLKPAQTRVRIARAQYAVATSMLLPSVGLAALPPTGTGANINQLIALSGIVDPDFFGKNRQTQKMAHANLQAEEADLEWSTISLYSEIATSYLELREAQARNSVLRNNLTSNKQTLQFIRSRYKAGQVSYLNLAQQDGLIEAQMAELEQNKALIIAILHKIELLTGNNPGVLSKKLLPPKPIPQMTANIHLGLPSELLRRRPDIIAAERRVAALHANVRVAMANLLPQVNIGWLLGWQTETISAGLLAAGSFFKVKNPDSTFFGTFQAPIFNVSLFNTIELRRREKVIAILQYQMTVLRALHDVENQYNSLQHFKRSAVHLKRVVERKHLALKLAKDAYHKAFSDFNTVLHTEEELNHTEFAYLQNIVRVQISLINLHKALGGNIVKSDHKAGSSD